MKAEDLDVTAVEKSWNQHTRLLFLCSPNNPSGNLLGGEKIKSLLSQFHGLVILDEAYIDFTDYPGFLPLLNEYKNLVVLQTLSKAWGLAGIRLGMCFATPEVIQQLRNDGASVQTFGGPRSDTTIVFRYLT